MPLQITPIQQFEQLQRETLELAFSQDGNILSHPMEMLFISGKFMKMETGAMSVHSRFRG
jgi:hypothetical protein